MNLESWEMYKKTISPKMPSLAENLCDGASDEEIRTTEEKMNVVFPEQLKSLYKANNGEDVIILSLPEQPEVYFTDYLRNENSVH